MKKKPKMPPENLRLTGVVSVHEYFKDCSLMYQMSFVQLELYKWAFPLSKHQSEDLLTS